MIDKLVRAGKGTTAEFTSNGTGMKNTTSKINKTTIQRETATEHNFRRLSETKSSVLYSFFNTIKSMRVPSDLAATSPQNIFL